MSATNQNQEIDKLPKNYQHDVWIYRKKIPENICNLIVEDFNNKNYGVGEIANHKVDKTFRFVQTVPVPLDHWCLGIPMYFGFDANASNFRYNISHLEYTDFLKYEKGMFYKTHIDVSPNIEDPTHYRKLTVIVQLSDESDYTGGDINLYDDSLNPNVLPKEKGTIIVFKSFLPHSVSEVTSGVRYSLCGWIMGPSFV